MKRSRRNYAAAKKLTNGTCVYCFQSADSIDHLTPFSQGGSNDLSNLAPACMRCNLIASNKVFRTFQEKYEYVSSRVYTKLKQLDEIGRRIQNWNPILYPKGIPDRGSTLSAITSPAPPESPQPILPPDRSDEALPGIQTTPLPQEPRRLWTFEKLPQRLVTLSEKHLDIISTNVDISVEVKTLAAIFLQELDKPNPRVGLLNSILKNLKEIEPEGLFFQ